MTAGSAVPGEAVGRRVRSPRWTAFVAALLLTVFAGLGLAFTLAAIEIQSAVRASISSESTWSKAQQEAVYFLHRYAETGDPAYFRRAQQAFAVPLAYRRVRLALNEDPPDRAAAHEALLRGGVDPKDISGVIWLYRNFSGTLALRRATDLWQQGDAYILRIREIGRELQRELNARAPSTAYIDALEAELEALNEQVRPIERAFSEALTEGARTLHRLLVGAGLLLLVVLIAGAVATILWAARAIRNSEEKYRAIFEQAAIGIAQLTPAGRFIEVNDSLCRILRRSRDELLSLSLADVTDAPVLEPAEDDNRDDTLSQARRHNQSAERRMVRGDGSTIWCKLTFSMVDMDRGIHGNVIAIIEDISQARALSSELSYQATHDLLTGLLNRVAFENRLRGVIHEVHEFDTRHVLCFLDLDQFKIINDTCGHLAGDELLRQVADVLRQSLRRNDVLARLGGDEFAVIFSQCRLEDARIVADKLREMLAASTFIWEGATFNITASLGLVEINKNVSEEISVLRAADTACYAAKDRGRNAVHVYVEEDLGFAERRTQMEWVGHIREAVADNRLQLVAQRIISLKDETDLRFEVLVRLLDTNNRIVLPTTFFPAAERYNVATLIDRWMVNETLKILENYGERLEHLGVCHLNLSAQSISRREFLDFILARLSQSGVPPAKICFEITETAVISNMADARHFIESLRNLGCHFALDDFGVGLSSFGYLRSLPVDMIKIDGSFVQNILDDEVHLEMVRSISEIGHLMNKQTVAEFVETPEILKKLRTLGIDFAQGYAIHKPCKLSDLLARTRKQAFLSTLPDMEEIYDRN